MDDLDTAVREGVLCAAKPDDGDGNPVVRIAQLCGEMFAQLHLLNVGGQTREGALLTFQEAAKHLGIEKTTFRSLIDTGSIPVVELTPGCPRVDPQDLAAFVAARKVRRGR